MDPINFDVKNLTVPELAELIDYHDRRYWQFHDPQIPDTRYDELVRALRDRDPGHPILTRVNAPAVAASGKVRHPEPMLSLDKAYSLSEVVEWAKKSARTPDEMLLVEPKYDGISARFDGRVLSTRGDGVEGENISDKLPMIELESRNYTGAVDRPARGELVIRDDDFKARYGTIVRKGGGVYKNSRNAVAGLMGLKDISEMLAQGAKITLVDYNLISFAVPLNQLESRWQELLVKLAALPYPQDGVVIKLADESFRRSLGNTAHHPRGEIAYKFTNQSRQTKLLDVEWSFGKSCLTPVALLAPVDIGGITIKRATLHNVQNIIDLDLKIGDTVTVERAGDVIPYISDSQPAAGERRSPLIDRCPGCGTGLVRRGPELCCPNRECFETNLQLLAAAVRNLGMENLGEPTLRKLMLQYHVRHLKDLFGLSVGDLLKVEGFAAKSAANLHREIQKARRVSDHALLAALNIPHVGPNIAKLLLAGRCMAQLRTMDEEALATVDGIGPERARALVEAFSTQSAYLDEMLSAVTLIHEETGGDRPTVCFTGKMPEKREHYAALAKAAGYEVRDDVGAALSLLVAADPQSDSGKLQKARKSGVKVMALEDFLSMIQTSPEDSQNSAAPPPEAGSDDAPSDAPDTAPDSTPEQLELF